MVGDFPAEEQCHGQNASSYRKPTGNPQQWCTYHQIVPIIDAAGSAAAVMHHPGLKRTEEENADDVAYAVKSRHADQKTVTKPTSPVCKEKGNIQSNPGDQNPQGAAVCFADFLFRRGLSGGLKPASEFLLAAETFYTGGEKPEDHGAHQQQPDKSQNSWMSRARGAYGQIRDKLRWSLQCINY